MNIFLVLFCMWGICFTLQYAKIFNSPREWLCEKVPFIDSLLSCSFCTGAWSGLLTYLLFQLPSISIIWNEAIIYFFVGAAWCYTCDLISDWLEVQNSKDK